MSKTKSPFVDWVSFTESNLDSASKEWAAGCDALHQGGGAAVWRAGSSQTEALDRTLPLQNSQL